MTNSFWCSWFGHEYEGESGTDRACRRCERHELVARTVGTERQTSTPPPMASRISVSGTLRVTESGGLEYRGVGPEFMELDIDPQRSLMLAREIVRIHDAIFEREKAFREKSKESDQ